MKEGISPVDRKLVDPIVKPWPELLDLVFFDGRTFNGRFYGSCPSSISDIFCRVHQTAEIVGERPSDVREGKFGKLIVSGKDLPGNSFLMIEKESTDVKYWKVVDAKRKGDDFFINKKILDNSLGYKIAVIERAEVYY